MADSRELSSSLQRRMVNYGAGQPRGLVAPPRRPGVGAQLPALPPGAQQLSPQPALRSSKRRPDAASTASLHDASLAHRSSKATLAAGAELLSASAPMPYAKIARTLPVAPAAVNVSDPPAEAEDAAPRALKTARSAADGAERRDPFWFIRMLRTELSDHEFAYMNLADAEGVTWDPYNLKIVAFNEVDPANHYTISEAGVTHCMRSGKQEIAEFTPLEQWEEECTLFHEVMEIPFFKRYQSWKAYTSWSRAIKADKSSACSQVRPAALLSSPHTQPPTASAGFFFFARVGAA